MSNHPISNPSVLTFDGQDDYLVIPNQDAINFDQNQNFCIEFWLKVGTIASSSSTIFDVNIIEKWQGSAFPYSIRYSSSKGTLYSSRYDGKNPSVSSKIVLNDEKFHHVAFVKQDSQLFLYIDGTEQSQTQDTIVQSTKNNSPLYLAAGTSVSKGGGTRRFFAGQIADFRLWNVGRSLEEIQQKMNTRLVGNEPGLVGYYPLNGDGNDKTSNANHATINGDAIWQEADLPIQDLSTNVSSDTNNSVLFFDGIDDNLTLPKGFPTIDKAITIEFWAKGENSPEQATSVFNACNAQGNRLANVHLPWGGQIYWDAGDEKGSFDRINKAVKLEEYNVWTHWAFIKDVATGKILIYRQGGLWHQGEGQKKSLAGIETFIIGCFSLNYACWKGCLTEFRIWNVARTPEEIQQKMNTRLTGNEPGLVSYYPLNGDANDKTSNGNHGIINGAIWQREELPIQAAIPDEIEKTEETRSATIERQPITGGNTPTHHGIADSRSNFYIVDTNNPVNGDGELTEWEIWAENTLPAQLILYRKEADSWSVVGKSEVQTPVAGLNLFSLATPIQVKKGDFVGIYYPQGGCVSFFKENSAAWAMGNLSGKMLFTGSGAGPTAFSDSSNRTYSLKVKGYVAVETQPSVSNSVSEIPQNLQSVLMFDGKDDYVALPAANIDYSQGFTVEAWVRYGSFQQSWSRIIDFGNAAGQNNIVLGHRETSNTLAFHLYSSAGIDALEIPNALELGKWTHIAVTIDQSGSAKLYKDGQFIQSQPFHLPEHVNRTLNYIARSNWAPDGYFQGEIAEFRLWNIARSLEEIQQKMNTRLVGNEPGLVGYYPLNGDANDKTSNGNHGVINGAIWKSEELPLQTPASESALTVANLLTDSKIKLKSWKGDYLHRPDTAQGVTTWNTGVGNEWTVEVLGDNKIKLKSWKGDYLHRPDTAQDVTTWSTGIGNEWELELILVANVDPVNLPEQANVLTFDGVDDYLTITVNEPETEITHELYFKTLDPNAGLFAVVDGNLGAGGHDRHLYLKDGNIKARLWNNQEINSQGLNFADGNWHHVAYVLGASVGGQKLYIDGQLVASGDKTASDFNWQKLIHVGFSNDAVHPYLKGDIAEVRLWNKTRSQTEIQENMNTPLVGNEPGLLGYYPLNGDANDKTSNGNHGVINGAIWQKEELPFKLEPAILANTSSVLQFDGQDDCVNLGKKSVFKIEKNLTIEAWINAETQKEWAGILCNILDTGLTESGYGLLLDGKSGIYLGLEPKEQAVENMPYLSSGANTLNLNQWHHVAGTYNGEQMKVYIDGVEKATLAVSPSPIKYDPENDLLIGMYKDDNESYAFKGKIAEVRLWNCTRSAEEIKANMNRYLVGNEAGLVGYWPLNEGSGNLVTDQTSNGNNGTINGAIWQPEELPLQAAIPDEIENPVTTGDQTPTPNETTDSSSTTSEIPKNLQSVLMFDGKDDYIEVPYSPSLNPDLFTISCWVKVAGGEGSFRSVVTCRDQFKGYIIYAGDNNKWQAWVGNGSAWEVVNNNEIPVVLNVWTHLASTFDGKQLKLYVDGTEVGSKNVVYGLNTQRPLRIGTGATEANPQYFYSGQIAEVSVWNKALTEAEIQGKMYEPLTGKEDGLAAYFPLNEGSGNVVNNKTEQGNNGTIHGAIWQQEELPQKVDKTDSLQSVLTFDGINDYIKLPDGILTASYTKEAWIKLAEPANPANNILSGNQHALYVPNMISAGHNGQWGMVQAPQPCPKNIWVHVALTYDSQTQGMCLYQNGELVSQASNIPPFDASDATMDIGVHRNGYFFKGEMAEVRIWNFARTPEMIQETMSSRLSGQETGLVAYFPLNEGSGSSVNDKTGQGNNGTINGAAWKQEELPIQETNSGAIEGQITTEENPQVPTQPPTSEFVKVGPTGGSISAPDFELLPDKTTAKSRLKSVFMNASWAIGTLQVEYENIDSASGETNRTEIIGSGGGDTNEFSIQPGDYLTKITGTWGRQAPGYPKEEIITLQFETQNGIKSPIYGGGSGNTEVEPFVLEAPQGQEIIGFFGSHGGPQDLLVRLGIYCQPISIPENQQSPESVQPPETPVKPENQQSPESVQPPETPMKPENQQSPESVQPPETPVKPENQQPSSTAKASESVVKPENQQSSETVLKFRKGFSYDEAILMTTFSQYAFEFFEYDDGGVEDSELKTAYKAIYKNQGWELVHTIRNDNTNIRGLILKNTQPEFAHQYVISLRGTSFNYKSSVVSLDNIISDIDWKLINYGALAVQRAKVVRGVQEAFECVADQIQYFFKTLRGELKSSDFRQIRQLPPLRQFACITALADVGGVRLGAEFDEQAQDLVAKVVADGEIDNDEELEKILQFLEEHLLSKLSPPPKPIEVWVTGFSLGGALSQVVALSLRRWFGSAKAGGLLLKVYALASPKIGNQEFIDFYNEQIGEELAYRIENTLDIVPTYPYDPPLLSAIAPQGLRVGNVFLGKYANGGELISLVGLGDGQSMSLTFAGFFDLPFNIPFPHSPEVYIKLLEDQKAFWSQLARPVKDLARPFLVDMLRDE